MIQPKIIQRLTSINVFQFFSLCAVILSSSYYFKIADNDLFARIAVGKLIWNDFSVPTVDTFAYAPTKAIWIDHEWLSGFIFYALDQAGGDLALFIFTLVVSFITIFFLILAQKNLSDENNISSALFFLALFPCSFIWNSTVRAQNLSFLFFAILIWIITKFEKTGERKWLLLPPLIMIPWINTHAGFVVGLGLLGTVTLSSVIKHTSKSVILILCMVVSLATILINPYGLAYIEFILMAVGKDRSLITEWSHLTLSPEHFLFGLFSILFFSCLISKVRNRLHLGLTIFTIIAWYFGLKHQRLIPFFIFSVCIVTPSALKELLGMASNFINTRVTNLLTAISLCRIISIPIGIFTFVNLCMTYQSFHLDYSQYPVEAMSWLTANRPGGRLMVHFNHGSYALLHGYPNFKVSMDGRYEEVYLDSTVEQSLAALNPLDQNFENSFLALEPDYVLICEHTTPLSVAAKFPGNWGQIFIDNQRECAIFGKVEPKSVP